MQTGDSNLEFFRVEKVVSGPLMDAGPDHLTVRDMAAGESLTIRVDDRTRFVWRQPAQQGQLTDTGQVRVGFYYAGGVHTAAEVVVLDSGDGAPIVGGRLAPQVH